MNKSFILFTLIFVFLLITFINSQENKKINNQFDDFLSDSITNTFRRRSRRRRRRRRREAERRRKEAERRKQLVELQKRKAELEKRKRIKDKIKKTAIDNYSDQKKICDSISDSINNSKSRLKQIGQKYIKLGDNNYDINFINKNELDLDNYVKLFSDSISESDAFRRSRRRRRRRRRRRQEAERRRKIAEGKKLNREIAENYKKLKICESKLAPLQKKRSIYLNYMLWKKFRTKLLISITERKEWCKNLNNQDKCDNKLKGTLCQILVNPRSVNWSSEDLNNLSKFLRYAPKFGPVFKPNKVGIDGEISELYKKLILFSDEKTTVRASLFKKLMINKPSKKNSCYPWEESDFKTTKWINQIKKLDQTNSISYSNLFSFNAAAEREQLDYCDMLKDDSQQSIEKMKEYKNNHNIKKQWHERYKNTEQKRKQCLKDLQNIVKDNSLKPNYWIKTLNIHESTGFLRAEKVSDKKIQSDSNSLSSKTKYHVKTTVRTIVVKGSKFKMSLSSKGITSIDVKPSKNWFDNDFFRKNVKNTKLWVNTLKYGGSNGTFPLLPKKIYLIYKPKIEIVVSKSQYEKLKEISKNKNVLSLFISNLKFSTKSKSKTLNDLIENEKYDLDLSEIKFEKPKKIEEKYKKEFKSFIAKDLENDNIVNSFTEKTMEQFFDNYFQNNIEGYSLSDAVSFGERRRKTRHVMVHKRVKKFVYEGEYRITFHSNDDKPQILAVVSDIL